VTGVNLLGHATKKPYSILELYLIACRPFRRLGDLESRFSQMQFTLIAGLSAVVAALLAAPHL